MNGRQRERRNLWFYPLGTTGRDMLYVLIANYLLTYSMFTRELTAPQLGAISVIMVAARLFDALNDPFMGGIIERTRSRWGKFKPWLASGAVLTSLVVIFLFNTSLNGWPFVAAFGLCYFAYSITFTMNDIAYWGMIPALSRDSGIRDQLTSRTVLCAGIGTAVASVTIPMFTTGRTALGGNARTGFGLVALIICILAPLFQLFTLLGVKEDRVQNQNAPEPVSFRRILNAILRNDQLLWASLFLFLQQMGTGIISGGIASTYIYFTFGYRGGLYSTFTIVSLSATAILMIFYPAISRRLGRKRLLHLLILTAGLGYVLMVASLAFGQAAAGFWVLTAGGMLGSFGQYGFCLVAILSILNTVEYNEYRFGRREETLIASLRPFVTKLSLALSVFLTSFTYLIFNVTGYTNQISFLENQAASDHITEAEKLAAIDEILSSVSRKQTAGLLLVMVLLSFGFMLAAFLIYRRKYFLDEKEYDRIRRELEARKN